MSYLRYLCLFIYLIVVVECFISSVQQVYFWVIKVWVISSIQFSILIPQPFTPINKIYINVWLIGFRWEVVVHFVDIGGIVDHQSIFSQVLTSLKLKCHA
jgi:hypothetical protein